MYVSCYEIYNWCSCRFVGCGGVDKSLVFIKSEVVVQWNPLSPKTHYKKIRVTHDVFDGPADSLLCYACCSRT
jgi:hypothetical protein